MNRAELRKKLREMNIRESVYSLDGGLKSDAFILDEAHGRWWVFYFDERGNRNREREFASEQEACDDFLKRISSDLRWAQGSQAVPPNPDTTE